MRPDDSSGGKPPPEGGRLKDKDNMYRQLLETLDDVLYAIDPDGIVDSRVNFIEKPFSVKFLAAKVRTVLDQSL